MKGNFHVRFLGEEAAVMPVSLPDHPLRHARIEKLAGTIAQRVPEDVRITRVSVTIRKPAALDHGEPGVTMWREQES